jgi:hypothetical protein
MSGDLIFGGSRDPDDEPRGLLARRNRDRRTVARQAERNLNKLVASARHEEAKAVLRKRLAENGMQDVTDVAHLAQELANGDQYVAGLLIPIVQEFGRQTARDIRDFGRGTDFWG